MTQKNIIIILSLLCVLSACRYKEGPFMNFTPVKDRIRGQWKVNTIQKDGASTTESPSIAESLNNYFYFYISNRLQIEYWENNTVCQADGDYKFSSNKKELIVNFTDIRAYQRTYEILKFKNKELKVKFTDDNNTVWILEFTLIQSFVPYGL